VPKCAPNAPKKTASDGTRLPGSPATPDSAVSESEAQEKKE